MCCTTFRSCGVVYLYIVVLLYHYKGCSVIIHVYSGVAELHMVLYQIVVLSYGVVPGPVFFKSLNSNQVLTLC